MLNDKIPVYCDSFLNKDTHFLVGNDLYSYKYYHPYLDGKPAKVNGVDW